MCDVKYDALQPNETSHVRHGRYDSSFDALFDEIIRIQMLHQCLHNQEQSVPQRNNVNWQPMKSVRLLIKLQIAANSQSMMRLFQYIIYDLQMENQPCELQLVCHCFFFIVQHILVL